MQTRCLGFTYSIAIVAGKPIRQLKFQSLKSVISTVPQTDLAGDFQIESRRSGLSNLAQQRLQRFFGLDRLAVGVEIVTLLLNPLASSHVARPVQDLLDLVVRTPHPNVQFRFDSNGLGIVPPIGLQSLIELVSRNKLGGAGERFTGTPAADNGQLFIRSNKKLYCIAE